MGALGNILQINARHYASVSLKASLSFAGQQTISTERALTQCLA